MIESVNVPNCVPILYEFDGHTGDLIGGSKYLGDPKYIKEMTKKVASIGNWLMKINLLLFFIKSELNLYKD